MIWLIPKGSSSGIGVELALAFAKLDACVIITGRDEQGIAKVSAKCQQLSPSGHEPLQVKADVSKLEDLKHLKAQVLHKHQKLDILINNAGFFRAAPISEDEAFLDGLDKVIDTNLKAAIKLTALFLESLVQSKGNVINVSSILGKRPQQGMMSYCVTKSGLDMATKCMASELTPRGVRVNGIRPAVIETPIFSKAGLQDSVVQEVYGNCGKYPIGRSGTVEDLVGAVKYLSSSAASFVTGVTLPVEGGFLLTSCGVI